jgi:O-antigen/teichoic acid export membrane protein
MKNKKFYILFTLSSLLSMFTTFIMIGYFGEEQYGQYSLYILYISYFALLSFGYQDGLLLNYRQKQLSLNHKNLKFELLFMSVFQFIIFIVILFMALFFDLSIIWIYAILAMFPSIIITLLKNIFQSTNHLNTMIMTDFILKIMTFIGIMLIILLGYELDAFLIFDIIIKYLIMIIFILYLFVITKQFKDTNQENRVTKKLIYNNFNIGFFIMFGNWILVFLYGMDKVFLKSNPIALGTYAVAMSCISIFITLLLPIRTVFLTSVRIDISKNEIRNIVKVLNLVGIILATTYSFMVLPLIIRFDILKDFQDAFYILGILCVLLPVIINVQIILSNLLILKYNKLYTQINILLIIVFFIAFKVSGDIYGITMKATLIAVLISYTMQYLVYLAVLLRNKEFFHEVLYISLWTILFLLTFLFGILYSSIFVLCIILYVSKNIRFIMSFIKQKES